MILLALSGQYNCHKTVLCPWYSSESHFHMPFLELLVESSRPVVYFFHLVLLLEFQIHPCSGNLEDVHSQEGGVAVVTY